MLLIVQTEDGRLEEGAQGVRSLPPGPLVAGGFALVTVLGTTQTWARALFIPISGTDTDRGMIALIAALIGAALCGIRAFNGLRDRWYFALNLALAAVTLAMPLWFYADIITQDSNELFGDVISASFGLYLTILAGGGYAGSLVWQLGKRPAA
jgi:hypothetical protein